MRREMIARRAPVNAPASASQIEHGDDRPRGLIALYERGAPVYEGSL